MKWETITNNVAHQVFSEIKSTSNVAGIMGITSLVEHLKGTHSLSTHAGRNVFANEVYDAIKRWDIRNYNKLKEFFPKYFPKNVSRIELTDNGWELI